MLTKKFTEKWESSKTYNPDKKEISFLDFKNPDYNKFFKDVVSKYIVKQTPLSSLTEQEKVRLWIFFLLQIATSIAPNDNHEFLMRILRPLSQNSLFKFALLRVLDVTKKQTSIELNLPFNGGYCLTNTDSQYVFAFPHTPTEIFLISISTNPEEYEESYLLQSSYGSKNQGVILGKESKADSSTKIVKQKSQNDKKMGDLCAQLKDPKRSIEILGHLSKDIPGLNSNLLLKGLDFGLKFWPGK